MLTDNHIFVKLTRKYCNIINIRYEVTKIFNEKNIINEHTLEGLEYLIKFGGLTIIYSDFIPTYAPCSICSESSIYLSTGINDEDVHVVGISIYHKTPENYWFTFGYVYIWGDCLNIANYTFNTVVTKFGKEQLKKLYYGLFIFKHYENITFDIYCKIGEQLFELLCHIEENKEKNL